METSSSSSGLTNTETGTDTNEQVSPCYNFQDIVAACASDTTDYPDSIDSEECGYSQRSQLTSNGMEDRCKHCECKGCRDYSTSNQPVAVAISKVLHSHHSKEKKSNQLKSYSRKIQESWYKKYPWITVCSFQYRIFCRLCCYAKQQKLLTNSDHTKSPFINNRFANWKKAL